MKERLSEDNVRIEYLSRINYAMSINGKRCVDFFELYNNDEEDWKDVRVTVTGDMIQPSQGQVETIERGMTIRVEGIEVTPDIDQLRELSESADTTFNIQVTIGGCEVYNQNYPLRLLAFNEWPGTSIMPELVAAFVTPNTPELSPLLVNAARVLDRLTGSSALDEYQTQDPNRVRAQVAAIYEALRDESIVYCTPPASFERTGQRIRLTSEMLVSKLGTCLDTTLLMATCCEAIGLHPLVVFCEGHAFLGCWLTDNHYPQLFGDDVSVLTKSIQDGINEMVIVESTCITQQGVSFEDAVRQAENFIYKNPDRFEIFVDIHRCRLDQIRPLPVKVNGVWQSDGIGHDHVTREVKEQTQVEIPVGEAGVSSRQQIWERKLLDFSLRNNLLNMRIGKKLVPFMSYDIDHLEDHLQAGEDYSILPSPTKKLIDPNEHGIYDSKTHREELEAVVGECLKHNQLPSYLSETDLRDALKGLYRTSRTALEENGANSLFLVFGMLKWYETEKSVRPRYAPLLLVPVDLIRRSANNYILRTREEEPTFNTTLSEMLRQQHEILLTGVNPLPTDNSGIDVKAVFNIVRACVKEHPRWEVIEESLLGLFSFNKFVMWNDIHNNAAKIRESAIIESLLQKRLVNFSETETPDTRQVDMTTEPGDYAIPVDVDSSQLEAVIESGEGRSFILHGPPGTGKSQTITNMIANALYHDRRVLFVAEKMAALEVVQKRLKKIGIEPFCLELHSNKVTKKHLLDQLAMALDITRIKSPDEYAAESKALFEQRKSLTGYIEALHSIRANGLSLYDLIARFEAVDSDDELTPTAALLATVNPQTLKEIETELRETDTVFAITGHPSRSALQGIDIIDGGVNAQQRISGALNALMPLLSPVSKCIAAVRQQFGIEVPDTAGGINWTYQFMQLVKSTPVVNGEVLNIAGITAMNNEWLNTVACGKRRDELKNALCAKYSPELLDRDAMQLKGEWQTVCDKWCLPRFFAKKSFIKKLRVYRADIGADDIDPMLAQLQEYQQMRRHCADKSNQTAHLFGLFGQNGSEQWAQIETSLRNGPQILQLLRQYRRMEGFTSYRINEAQLRQTDTAPLYQFGAALKGISDICVIDPSMTLNGLYQSIPVWLQNLSGARDWAQWCVRKRHLCERHLENAIDYIVGGAHTGEETAQAALKGIYRMMASQIIDSDPQLQMFNGMLYEDAINKFRDMSVNFQELTKKALYYRLASRIPSLTIQAANNSEMGILKRLIASGGRGATIRHIIDQIPTLLPRLCPCMLMSPISVAQFIDLNQEKFDIVVFDEASQMPTSEAVGAIARGKALIVVGDPRQMPPTSFFSTNQVDEADAENDDMESILDDCITLSIPSHYLTWHYRSRHESLIAFSNSQYYEGKLYTFPSIDDRVSKVQFFPIDGTYDYGRTRSNRAEAEAIVKEVIRRLSDPELSKLSLGIVSFSKVQQNLIEDILTDELSKHPQLEALAYDSAEPIFVKNLENVQGDERDVILFSIGYGPDKSGKVSMNFGPLNNAGGERRLNVAVSRARYEMCVFSTLRPEQIDLNRSRAKGVEGLKRFLEFAKNGRISVSSAQSQKNDQTDIAEDIAAEVRKLGYVADTHIGRSNFKIDIAISDPSDKDTYLLGILCDGRNYYGTKTERDREITQPGVLKGLGWNLLRIWTVDWFMKREQCIQQIKSQLEELKNGEGTVAAAPANASSKSGPISPLMPFAVAPDDIITRVENEHERPYPKKSYPVRSPYCTLEMLKGKRIEGILKEIITTEQPITRSLIAKRLAVVYGIPKMNAGILNYIEGQADQVAYCDPDSPYENPYYWSSEQMSKGYTYYRLSNDREPDDLPLIEVRNLVEYMIEQQVSTPNDVSLLSQVAKTLGYTRRSKKLDALVESAVKLLVDLGRITDHGGVLSKN